MFRLEAQLELLAEEVAPHRPNVELRGYDSESVAVTGEFIKEDGVSVGDVVAMCPTHRDVYLRRSKKVDSEMNWSRKAGVFIQDFLESVHASHNRTRSSGGVGNSSSSVVKEARRLWEAFLAEENGKNKKRLDKMDKLVASAHDLRSDELAQLLVNSAAADLFALQGALNYERVEGGGAERAMTALQLGVKYEPADYLKISKSSAPDIVLPKFGAIGDMKSGTFDDKYLMTVAGYALGYESCSSTADKKPNIDIGVLYLVETGDRTIGLSRPYFFWITDIHRRRFLDRRNQLLRVLADTNEPPVVSKKEERERYCARCPYSSICHPEKK